MYSHRGIVDKCSFFSFQLGKWAIPFNLTSDIGVGCTLTNLGGNGVNLDCAEGQPLTHFFALTKLLAFTWKVRKDMVLLSESIHRVFMQYKNQTITTAIKSEWNQS